jgi:hypothetical protein
VDKVALGQVFSEYFGFPCQLSFHPLRHTDHHLSSAAGTIGPAVPSGLSLTLPQETTLPSRFSQPFLKVRHRRYHCCSLLETVLKTAILPRVPWYILYNECSFPCSILRRPAPTASHGHEAHQPATSPAVFLVLKVVFLPRSHRLQDPCLGPIFAFQWRHELLSVNRNAYVMPT